MIMIDMIRVGVHQVTNDTDRGWLEWGINE